MGLGQYNSIGKYCGPHTASSVFLILVFTLDVEANKRLFIDWLNYEVVIKFIKTSVGANSVRNTSRFGEN